MGKIYFYKKFGELLHFLINIAKNVEKPLTSAASALVLTLIRQI